MHVDDNPGSPGDKSDCDLGHDEPVIPPIPEELEYLIDPAIEYGRKYQFDDAVQWFLENAEESAFETLAAIAERARIYGHYARFLQWADEVDDVCDRIVDERYPHTIDISEQEQKEFSEWINPDIPERRWEKLLRQTVETNDRSDIAKQRREMRTRLTTEADDSVHHMDVYFLFGLMDACDMKFE